jgi:hypothetical protein
MGEDNQDKVKRLAQEVSNCMLSQYFGTAAGLGIGLAAGIQRKSLRLFVISITFGTFADWVHGYTGPCRTMIQDFNYAKKALDDQVKAQKAEKK